MSEDSVSQILVSIPRQELRILAKDGTLIHQAPISSSRFGTGSEEGSFKTPTGRFQICQKIGAELPVGTIFKGRQPIGIYDFSGARQDEDLILTRILWLEGLEQHNSNTKQRFIYLHGTPHEDLIGTPASIGCIRLRTNDLLTLFKLSFENMPVTIIDEASPQSI